MKRRIGIVGAGIAGLHLALYLQKHGVDATLITDRAPDEYRGIRLLNTVAHHHGLDRYAACPDQHRPLINQSP